jgi:hypothetical protein
MIREASVFLHEEVERYLLRQRAVAAGDVLLANVALLEDQKEKLAGRVLLTVVNIEEESTLKNGAHLIRNPVSNGIESKSPPVHLNLYMLFSATPSELDDGYEKALWQISLVIELFQSKKEFTLQNTPGFVIGNLNRRLMNELRLHPELYTLTFEQMNHLWGALGGKQSPSVMYKVRLVRIQSMLTEETPVIQTVQNESQNIPATLGQ